MKTEDIKKMAQAWQNVQEAAYGKKEKKESSDTQMGTITVKTDAEREARAKAYRDKKAKNEELKGNQHKIDHNKDGKISAADFKGLRKKAKKDQEVEVQTSESKIDEVLDTPKAMYSHRNKAKYSKDRAANSAAAKILRDPKGFHSTDTSDELKTMDKRAKGLKMADKAAAKKTRAMLMKKEEVELDEGIEKMSHGRLKWHMNTGVPHGSYSKDEMKAERDRRMMHKDSAAAYKKAKPGLSEESIDEISKKTLGSYVKKASSDMANNAYALGARDPLKKPGSWDKAFKRKAGIAKATDKMTKESKDHGNMNNGSPAGEGLSPSAKKELARKTPMPDFVNEPKIDKKTFDAIRGSGKKAAARNGDNTAGDKNVINKPVDITAKASKKEDDGFKE